jgi:hypothetical protein
MLNGKWSSEKFQDEQFNEKFGAAFSDGDICIFRYNINVGNIPSQPYQKHRLQGLVTHVYASIVYLRG